MSFEIISAQSSGNTLDDLNQKSEWIFWQSGSSARIKYELAIANLALKNSVDKFGAYKLTLINQRYTALRSHQELLKKTYHFTASGDWINSDTQNKDYLRVPIPLWEGLQGYRQIMINKERYVDFNKVVDLESLKKLKPGQGNNWTEVLIYQDNGIEVVTADSLPALYKMLSRQRFDYIPLGINEMQGSLESANRENPDLVIYPNLLIHYPLHVYFQVSKEYPRLAERLNYGLSKAIENGSYEIIAKQFLEPIRAIRDKPDTIIIEINNSRTN